MDYQTLTPNPESARSQWRQVEIYMKKSGEPLDHSSLKLLELGSRFGEMLKHLVSIGIDAKGIEGSQEFSRRLPITHADASDLTMFQDGEFNFVYAHGFFDRNIYPKNEDGSVHAEVARVLRPMGIFYVSGGIIPNTELAVRAGFEVLQYDPNRRFYSILRKA